MNMNNALGAPPESSPLTTREIDLHDAYRYDGTESLDLSPLPYPEVPIRQTRSSSSSTLGRITSRFLGSLQNTTKPDGDRHSLESRRFEELVFDTRLQIVMKNPAMFRRFVDRAIKSRQLTQLGASAVFYIFVQDLRIVELLDDIRREASRRIRRSSGGGLFTSLGYSSNKSTSSSSVNIDAQEYAPKPTTPMCNRRAHNHRQRKVRVYDPSLDDQSVISSDTHDLTLPSLDATAEESSDEESSVGSLWSVKEEQPNNNSGRSFLPMI
jgi:hypothetical protein